MTKLKTALLFIPVKLEMEALWELILCFKVIWNGKHQANSRKLLEWMLNVVTVKLQLARQI